MSGIVESFWGGFMLCASMLVVLYSYRTNKASLQTLAAVLSIGSVEQDIARGGSDPSNKANMRSHQQTLKSVVFFTPEGVLFQKCSYNISLFFIVGFMSPLM